MSLFEIMMLICFGVSWPFALYKTYMAKSAAGKSFLFMTFVMIGYLAGILNKVFYHFDHVIWLYVLNLLMVAADFTLATVYRIREKSAV